MTIKIELFLVPGCNKCAEAKEALKTVAEGFGADKVAWRDVDILEEMDYAAVGQGVVVRSRKAPVTVDRRLERQDEGR